MGIESSEFGCHWRAQECMDGDEDHRRRGKLEETINGFRILVFEEHECYTLFVGSRTKRSWRYSGSLSDIGDIDVLFLEDVGRHMKK